jgi:hypothetical protein
MLDFFLRCDLEGLPPDYDTMDNSPLIFSTSFSFSWVVLVGD